MQKTNIHRTHVIKRQNGWVVLKEGASRASRVFDSREEAIKQAEKIARAGGDLIIHTQSGMVEEWIRYEEK